MAVRGPRSSQKSTLAFSRRAKTLAQRPKRSRRYLGMGSDGKDRLAAARAAQAAKRARGDKVEILDPVEKAKRNPASRALAIAAKCWDCQGGDADPHPRWRIGNCQITDCPLWPLRPYQAQHGRPEPASLRATTADGRTDPNFAWSGSWSDTGPLR